MRRLKIILALFLHAGLVFGQNDFSFVFLPDLHLNTDSATEANFDRLTVQIKNLRPDFILTGGDMIYTAKSLNEGKATALFDFMKVKFRKLNMPVYYTIGNHEITGLLPESGMEISNSMWGKGLYEKKITKRYYSFSISGWKFFLLDGIKILEKERNYTSGVDSEQINWLKKEMEITDKNTPTVIVIHTPLLNPHAIVNSKSHLLSQNSESILQIFKDSNLKVVLEGHTHLYMNLLFEGIHYISGGSTSFATDLTKYSDGFVLIKVKNNVEEIQFVPTDRSSVKLK